MELVVRALRCPPPDQPQAIQARFGAGGGRIGRSNTCALPLPSPDRYISREHLEIRCRDGKFTLKVISKVNGCSVNDSAVPPGAAVELADGDKIQLGDYVLVAELLSEATALMKDPLAAFGRTASGRVDSLDMMASLAPPPVSREQQFDTSPDWARAGQSKARTPPPLPRLSDPLESDPSGPAFGQMLESAPSASRNRPATAAVAKAPPLGRDDAGASALDAFLGLDGPLAAPPSLAMSDQAQGLYRQRDVDLAMPGQAAASAPDPFDDDIFSALDALEKDFAPAPPVAPAPPHARARAHHAAAAADPLDMDLLGAAAVATPLPVRVPVAEPRPH